MISFDTNVLIYATAVGADERARRARELLARAIRAANSVLLLQSLAEFSNVAMRKAGIPIQAVQGIVQAWCAVLPIQAADESDLMAALEAVRTHRLAFWDALLWASAQRAGVRQPAYVERSRLVATAVCARTGAARHPSPVGHRARLKILSALGMSERAARSAI